MDPLPSFSSCASHELLRTLKLPAVARAAELAREVTALGCVGALVGPPGTGKTTALQLTAADYPGWGLPGRAHLYRATAAAGPTRGVRDLLESLGLRAGSLARGMSLKVILRLARRELDARDIRLILADGVDAAYDLEALLGLLALLDAARQEGRPLALLCAGERDLARWLAGSDAALSRTLRQERFAPLTLGETLGVLRDWLPAAFEAVAAGAEKGDKAALAVARAVQERTGGALRRLEMFARLWLLQPGGGAARPEAKRVEALLAKLHAEGREE